MQFKEKAKTFGTRRTLTK